MKLLLVLEIDEIMQMNRSFIVLLQHKDTFAIGDSIMELVTPSSGEKTYYRMLNNRQVMLSDKEGTISQSLLAEHYILNKK